MFKPRHRKLSYAQMSSSASSVFASLNVSEDYIPPTQVEDDDLEDEEDDESQMSLSDQKEKVWGNLIALMGGLEYVPLTKSEYTFGRSSSCDVTLTDPRVSGTHCTIYRLNQSKNMSASSRSQDSDSFEVYIKDSSANGTYLNGKRLEKNKPVLLESSDKISLVLRKPKGNKPPAAIFRFQKCMSSAKDKITRKYELRKVLGTGACGQVVEGIERSTGKRFAVKIIEKKRLGQHAAGGGIVDPAALLREADILKTVQHRNITMFKELFQTPKVVYIVMEYVGGGELLDHILERGYYSEPESAIILKRILDAVNYLHDRNIVHRDLKPENILLTTRKGTYKDGVLVDPLDLKITDFGLAKFLGNEGLRTYCGTPQYFAPEVLSRKSTVCGVGRYGKAVDMWSIGVILYVLLTGVPPFDDDVLFDQIEGADYDTTCDRWPQLSPAAKDLISKLLIRSPHRRLTAAQAMMHPFVTKMSAAYLDRLRAGAERVVDKNATTTLPASKDDSTVSEDGPLRCSQNARTRSTEPLLSDSVSSCERNNSGDKTNVVEQSSSSLSTSGVLLDRQDTRGSRTSVNVSVSSDVILTDLSSMQNASPGFATKGNSGCGSMKKKRKNAPVGVATGIVEDMQSSKKKQRTKGGAFPLREI